MNKQQELHDKILDLVKVYCDKYNNQAHSFSEEYSIPYASKGYAHEEMCSLVDSALEFWLTSGKYVQKFEADLGRYLGVRYVTTVNSSSSANQLSFTFMTF